MDENTRQQVAADLGISDLSAEQQQQVIGEFGEIALKAATIAVVQKLSDEKRAEFADLTKSGDVKTVQEFLDREVPDHEALAKAAVDAEVKRFREFQESRKDS